MAKGNSGMVDEARHIAKKTLEMEAKAKEIKRKVRVVYAKVKEKGHDCS